MQPPRMTTRRWMVVVAVVALMSWGVSWGGFLALALEVLILGASLTIWLERKGQSLAAGIVGATVFLCPIVGLLMPPATIYLGVGHTTVRISFLVSDADTGQPVEAASIQLEDPDLDEIPADPLGNPALPRSWTRRRPTSTSRPGVTVRHS